MKGWGLSQCNQWLQWCLAAPSPGYSPVNRPGSSVARQGIVAAKSATLDLFHPPLAIVNPDIGFRFTNGTRTEVCSPEMLAGVAKTLRLDHYIPRRYTNLFVFGLHVHLEVHGINPFQIIDEVRALEDFTQRSRTKPATQFAHPPLKGFWHKHFFSARFIPQNILTHLGSKGLEKIIREEMELGQKVTTETIAKISDRVVYDSVDARSSMNKLTGEWIVFAKHNGQNYYLCVATHDTGDAEIYRQLELMCFPQFPFLAPPTAT